MKANYQEIYLTNLVKVARDAWYTSAEKSDLAQRLFTYGKDPATLEERRANFLAALEDEKLQHDRYVAAKKAAGIFEKRYSSDNI
jgi:hypothetical protein